MLKLKVKVGKINNLSEARYCAGMGVDLLGFSIGNETTSLDPVKFKEITSWISGPSLVIEWTSDSIPHNLTTILQAYNARIAQIDARHLENIPQLDVKWIISMDIMDWPIYKKEVALHKNKIAYVIVRSLREHANWREVINEIGKEFPLLVEDADNTIIEALIQSPFAGLSLQGTDESGPGLKEYELSDILERLEE